MSAAGSAANVSASSTSVPPHRRQGSSVAQREEVEVMDHSAHIMEEYVAGLAATLSERRGERNARACAALEPAPQPAAR